MSQKVKNMLEKATSKIFFEKQDGALCGQHCLNNALQQNLFSPVDLSEIASALDEKERQTMAERGTNTKEYKDFISKASSNFDDTGYFSVQVLSEALRNMNLELVSFNSDDPRAAIARENPARQQLYVVHTEDHWFSMRKFGQQWVNLNSTLSAPELLTDTYFSMLLTTLQQEGGRLFLVLGELPSCEADEIFASLRRGENGRFFDENAGHRLGSADDLDEEVVLERGVKLSLSKSPQEAVRAQRAAFLNRLTQNSSQSPSPSSSGASPIASTSSSKDKDTKKEGAGHGK